MASWSESAGDAADSFPPNTTFRLQGIPKSVSGQPTSQQHIAQLIGQAWNSGHDVPLELHSFATDPFYDENKVATLTFEQSPSFLSPLERTWTAALEGIDNELVSLTLDLDFWGFTPFHSRPDSECTLDIIALPGLNEHAFASFEECSAGNSFMWLRDALPNDFPQARIYVYGYDSKLINSESSQEIPDLALNFRNGMANIRSEQRQLILLGHDLGGIIVKEAVIQMKEIARDGDEASGAAATLNNISALLFFGAPSEGMDNGAFELMSEDQPNNILVKSLGRSSGVLRTQMISFRRVFEEFNFLTFWYYELEETPTPKQSRTGVWKMTGEYRKLVEQTSATNGVPFDYGRHRVRGIPRNHYEMVKLQGIHDMTYQAIRGDLKQITSHPDQTFRRKSVEQALRQTREGYPIQRSSTIDQLVLDRTALITYCGSKENQESGDYVDAGSCV